MQQVRAKKFLGQHFLKDLSIAQKIAESLVFSSAQKMPVLEVGPGTGVLTQYLLHDSSISLTAIEIDRESIAFLKQKFPQLRLIEGDFLKINLDELYKDYNQFCIIGNYPYNISSQIFFKVLDYKNKIPCCSGMIQREVAQRIASKPNCKAYGILSVLLQAYYNIEYLFTVDEKVFDPPPKVKSAVIRLVRNERENLNCNEDFFRKVVKVAFNKRRKQLKNSLKELIGENDELLSEPIFLKRPEQLSVDEFISLTNLIENNN